MEKIDKSQLDKYTVDNLSGKEEIMAVLTNRNLNVILNKVNELVEAFNELENRLDAIGYEKENAYLADN